MDNYYKYGSCCFLNRSGDVTIRWSEEHNDKIVELIKKKMAAGYTFFTNKQIPIIKINRRRKITDKNINEATSIIIDDATLAKMIKSVDDKDIIDVVQNGDAAFTKPEHVDLVNLEIERDATVVAKSKSVAVRKLAGG